MPDQRQFRNTMGLFATGVAVIAVPAGDEVQAMTANAVSSVSLDPLLLLFCPAKKSHLSQHLAPAVPFSVNLLRADQVGISTYFAGAWLEPVPPPFRFVRVGATPKLEGCLASLICSVRSIVDGGDHWVVVGTVHELQQGSGPDEPLLFYKGRYGQLKLSAAGAAPDLAAVTDEPVHTHYDT
jgi:flavin reductase (DIM6/NTAB) family NADH-FMN oxidoreductase RutF